jgi:hypothetical protein
MGPKNTKGWGQSTQKTQGKRHHFQTQKRGPSRPRPPTPIQPSGRPSSGAHFWMSTRRPAAAPSPTKTAAKMGGQRRERDAGPVGCRAFTPRCCGWKCLPTMSPKPSECRKVVAAPAENAGTAELRRPKSPRRRRINRRKQPRRRRCCRLGGQSPPLRHLIRPSKCPEAPHHHAVHAIPAFKSDRQRTV